MNRAPPALDNEEGRLRTGKEWRRSAQPGPKSGKMALAREFLKSPAPKTAKMVLARESQHAGKTKIPEIPSWRCAPALREDQNPGNSVLPVCWDDAAGGTYAVSVWLKHEKWIPGPKVCFRG